MAYTPGGLAATPGGHGDGGYGSAAAAGGWQTAAPPLPDAPKRPDYSGVLVKLADGGVGVAGATHADGNTEATPLGGGAPVLLDVVELVEVGRKDAVKVVSGPLQGLTGAVISFDGGDVVLATGEVVDVSMLGKLHTPAAS
jgi:hypothetical protein